MSDDLNKLRTDYMGGHITRRELLRRAAVIGLSGPALGGFLAACASGTGTTKSAAPAIGTTVLTPPAKGEVDRVNWGLFYEPSGLDWIYDYNYEENTVVTNITESLLRLTPQLTIEPSLAASFSETDPLKKVYQIRQGVTFHDGSPMTADDVVFSRGGPIGTGPFAFKNWAQGSSIVLTRHESYWDTSHAPKVREIDFSFIPQESTMTTALLSGEIDGAYHTPYSGLDQLRGTSSGTLYLGKSMIFTEIIIAGTSGPLADHRLRTALLLAIDRPALAKTVYNGAATPLKNTVVPLPEWGYGQAQATAAWAKLPPPTVDLAQAKKLVAQAGPAAKKTMVIATRASFQRYINIATIVQAAATQIGLSVQIKPIAPNSYGDLFFSSKARSGIDMFISENYADIPEPLEILFPAVIPGQFYNYNGYNNPSVTSDLSQAIKEESDPKRASLVLSAQAVMANDLAALPLANPAVPLFLSKRITGAPASFCYLYYPWARDLGAPGT